MINLGNLHDFINSTVNDNQIEESIEVKENSNSSIRTKSAYDFNQIILYIDNSEAQKEWEDATNHIDFTLQKCAQLFGDDEKAFDDLCDTFTRIFTKYHDFGIRDVIPINLLRIVHLYDEQLNLNGIELN